MIPFVDLQAQYDSIKPEIDAAIARVIANRSFILGEEVEAFEQEFASFTGFKHVVGVGNGTDALHLALRACGLSPGDEVVAPTHTFIATTEAITLAGGVVRLADVSDGTFCMSQDTLDAATTAATRMVIPVVLYGNPAGLTEVLDTAERNGLGVVLDCAQAHGATMHGGKRLGDIANVATFSFFPGKNLGAYGDAGAVATNDSEVARKCRMWRNHGRVGKYAHEFEGLNSRMDGMQGAILRAKLPHLSGWTRSRRRVAESYREVLRDLPALSCPEECPDVEHVYHLFVVRCSNRDEVRKRLQAEGIASGVHYPTPIHLLPAYAHLGLRQGSFPVAERICEEILSLPIYPEMEDAQVSRVAEVLASSVK